MNTPKRGACQVHKRQRRKKRERENQRKTIVEPRNCCRRRSDALNCLRPNSPQFHPILELCWMINAWPEQQQVRGLTYTDRRKPVTLNRLRVTYDVRRRVCTALLVNSGRHTQAAATLSHAQSIQWGKGSVSFPLVKSDVTCVRYASHLRTRQL